MSPFRASDPITERWDHFDFAVADGVATLTLDRPDRLNALTFDVYADLRDLLRELPQREDVDAMIITGRGKGFCSGGDVDTIIGALLRMDARDLLEFTRMTGAVVQNMRECPIPIIAAVNGTAAGAGAVIALAADFRIVAETARFHFLFTKVGLSGGDMGSAYLLPRLVGLGRATEILMFGDPIDAARALEIGLANRVVPVGEVASAATEVARRLAEGPSFAYRATKLLLTRETDMGLTESIELEAMTQALLMTTADHAEFHAAFMAGRSAEWRGR
jgi:enoyl-CoA hydratase/carnithine racemase